MLLDIRWHLTFVSTKNHSESPGATPPPGFPGWDFNLYEISLPAFAGPESNEYFRRILPKQSGWLIK